jgi:hypothetical protein
MMRDKKVIHLKWWQCALIGAAYAAVVGAGIALGVCAALWKNGFLE